MLTSPESPKNSIDFTRRVGDGDDREARNATLAPSVGGARRLAPAARTTVTMRRTMTVIHGRTVTNQTHLFEYAGFICIAEFITRNELGAYFRFEDCDNGVSVGT